MASPTWLPDGIKRVIYEVPPGASYVTDGAGYRIYDGGPSNFALMTTDVKRDMWSRWTDWHALNDWALLAFAVSGGAQRPDGSYQGADFTLLTADGWRLVMANYPHETVIRGNLNAQGSDSLFDISRLTAQGIMPRLMGFDALITYSTGGGSGASAAEIATAVRAELATELARVLDLAKINGLVPGTDAIISATSRTAGDVVQSFADAAGVVTVSRA